MIVVPNPIQGIPDQVILEIHNMRKVDGLSWEIAISSVRKALVPDDYTAYPFRRNTPESFLDNVAFNCCNIYVLQQIGEIEAGGC